VKSREEIKEISGFGQIVYRNVIGFLRILDSDNKLDKTRIHPDNYNIALKICAECIGKPDDITIESLNQLLKKPELIRKLDNTKMSDFMTSKGITNNKPLIKSITEQLTYPFRTSYQKYIPLTSKDLFYQYVK